jgi:hypothetical protein
MPTLHELQKKIQRFIADGDACGCAVEVDGSPIIAPDRLGILRNNSLVTHTSVLAGVFPVVRRLVDPAFFAYLAHEFIRHNPPKHPCLSEYGDAFSGFVARFPPARKLAYLGDIARLEWAISRIANAPAQASMSLTQFASRGGDPALARLKLDSRVRLVASKHPIDLIWQLNQSDNSPGVAGVEASAAYLQVRAGQLELLRRVEKSDWIFRSLIATGDALGTAVETVLHFDRHFDLPCALAKLFAENLVVSCEE